MNQIIFINDIIVQIRYEKANIESLNTRIGNNFKEFFSQI
jgi:hypothetical protein